MTFDVFRSLATDESAENAGVWLDLSSVKFKIARSNTEQYYEEMETIADEFREALKKAKPKEAAKIEVDLLVKLYAKVVLRDWTEGVMYDGEPLPYSYENAVKLLQIKDFRQWVVKQATDLNNYKVAKFEADQKN